jgi:predicted amidohydrolase
VHNTAVLVNGDGVVGTYDKLHVAKLTKPDGEEANETRWFQAGLEAPVWRTDFGTVGPQICYDSSFPELSRVQSLNGAELLLNITASASGFEHVWEHFRFARAYENAAWYVACSVVGEQRGDRFFGRSAIIDPNGETIAEGKDGEEDLVIADIDPGRSTLWRERMNPLRARRPDAYADITRSIEDGKSG